MCRNLLHELDNGSTLAGEAVFLDTAERDCDHRLRASTDNL